MNTKYSQPKAEIVVLITATDVLQMSAETPSTLEGLLDLHQDVVDRVTW